MVGFFGSSPPLDALKLTGFLAEGMETEVR